MEISLSTAEKVYLLGIHPEKGGIMGSVGFTFDFALVAAFIYDLEETGNIKLEGKLVRIHSLISENEVHNIILRRFEKFGEPIKIGRWFNRLQFSVNPAKNALKESLAARRLIRLEPRRFLFFRWKKPYLVERMAVREILTELENKIFSHAQEVFREPILTLLEPSGLLVRIFHDGSKRREARRILKTKCQDNEIILAMKRAISASRAAIAS